MGYRGKTKQNFFGIFKDIYVNIRTLPYVIQQIVRPLPFLPNYVPTNQQCLTQFFAWIAWFPFLFYMTIYIGEIHVSSLPPPTLASSSSSISIPSPTPSAGLNSTAISEAEAEGTRLGNKAMLAHAIVSLVASTVVPFFVKNGSGSRSVEGSEKGKKKNRWYGTSLFSYI
jgi:hypothetical protein